MPRICQVTGCFAPAPWDDMIEGLWYCGPHIAVKAVNRFAAENRLAELGIQHMMDTIADSIATNQEA